MVPAQSNFPVSGVGVCTRERFAELAGVPVGVVDGWMKKGYLPSKSIGKYTLVNLVLFNAELLSDSEIQENQF